MADEDEIDILGDFSFNSCLAQNDQGIPSCSNREDTVHPQWFLDSTATNWYDIQRNREKGYKRKLSGTKTIDKYKSNSTIWSKSERDLLAKAMEKYGRNIHKISQTLKTKTEAEIQALIEAEFGVFLDPSPDHQNDLDNVPVVMHEEVKTEDSAINILNMVANGSVTIHVPKKPLKKNQKAKNRLLKPNVPDTLISSSEIFYDDDLIIGSTECIGSEEGANMFSIINQKEKMKAAKKHGNHRRKVSRNYDKGKTRNRSKDNLKSPQRKQKDSSVSDDCLKSPKMQIVLGSGQALPVSEGEQVIKIEKMKASEPESDIEIDVDSENEGNPHKKIEKKIPKLEEVPIAIPLGKFEPMPKRQKKINLNGDGGYTIMHTESGDMYTIGAEPRRERQPRKQPVHLIQCRMYNAEKPAPYEVRLHVSTLMLMDGHGHTSVGEVMGLVGGRWCGAELLISAYQTVEAAAGAEHCDMDPVSQCSAGAALLESGLAVCGWHHSHPRFAARPSAQDLRSQRALQAALDAHRPVLAALLSQHWPPGRAASHYRCFRVEDDESSDIPVGYQFSVKLIPDLNADNLDHFLRELRVIMRDDVKKNEFSVDLVKDVCPQAKMTYLEKFISSSLHHMRSAGYADDDPIVARLVKGVRDIFR